MINTNLFKTILNLSLNLSKNQEIFEEGRNIFKGLDFTSVLYTDFEAQNLFDFVHQYESELKFFFNEKDNSSSKLALDSIKTIKFDSEQNEIAKTIKNNPQITFYGANRFNCAEKQNDFWQGLDDCLYFIAKIEITNTNNTSHLKINIPNEVFLDANKLSEYFFDLLENFRTNIKTKNNNHIISTSLTPSYDEWDKMISTAHLAFENKIEAFSPLKKVILSRTEQFRFTDDVDTQNIARNLLASKFINSYFVYFEFANKVFISVTPEMLFEIKDSKVNIDSIAGTISRSKNETEDEAMACTLLSNPKEILEHEIVTKNILNSLKSININSKILFEKKILKLPHVQHIHSKIQADIQADKAQDLVKLLHPTAAIGGEPKKQAMEFILKHEDSPRGLYAAPIGYISGETSKMLVGIRSCLIDKNTMTLFGGCGVIKESVAIQEWQETQIKMNNFRGCIENLNS